MLFFLALNVTWCQDKGLQGFRFQGLNSMSSYFSSARSQDPAFCFSFKDTPVIQWYFLLSNHIFQPRLVKYFSEEMFSFPRVIENFRHVFECCKESILCICSRQSYNSLHWVFVGWFPTADLFSLLIFFEAYRIYNKHIYFSLQFYKES